MFSNDNMTEKLGNIQKLTLFAGVTGLIITIILGLTPWGNFFQSYLYAFIFWFGLALGSLGLLLIGHIAGGSWAAIVRRFLEAGAMIIPIMGLLFIPIILGANSLYEWTNTDPQYLADHPLVANKKSYLNISFFMIRAVIYFVAWSLLAWWFYSYSKQQDADESKAKEIGRKAQRLGAGGFMLTCVLMTFAAFDWGMSLNPEWYSGLYGVIFMIGQAISTMAFLIIATLLFAKVEPLKSVISKKLVQDLGNFLMAFTMFWAYVSVSQLIIIWSGNTIETNPWFVLRMQETTWRSVGAFLMVFHFFVPFIILFSRWVKQTHRLLFTVACWMLVVRLIDIFFYIIPEFDRKNALHFGDVTALIGLGGIWLWFFIERFKSRPILPLHDPRLVHNKATH